MADAWGENNWGEGFWGQQSSITVSVTGLSTTTALGTESVVADCLVTLDSLQVSSALGTATGEPEHVISVTGLHLKHNYLVHLQLKKVQVLFSEVYPHHLV